MEDTSIQSVPHRHDAAEPGASIRTAADSALAGAPDSPPAAGHLSNQADGPRLLNRLLAILTVLICLAIGPYVAGQFAYHYMYNRLQAGYDVATSGLSELKPRLNDLELASRLIARKVEPSVVSIIRPGGAVFRGGDSRFELQGQGSGVIVDKDGYIVTNYHVVEGADEIRVVLGDGRSTTASVIGEDPPTDVAVLKIDLPNLIAAEWGDSDALQVGDLVWAIGSPYGLDHTLTFGIVSAKSRRGASHLSPTSPFQEFLQTDAAVNPGNSGGPLVNIEGQVVGINSAIIGASFQGISFAIPSRVVQENYRQLRANGRIERAWLGVRPAAVPDEVREQLGLELGEGVFIEVVQPDSPADRAGLRPGDVILKWNDHAAKDPMLFSYTIAETEVGSTATVVLARGVGGGQRKQLELSVKVERRPRDGRPRRDGR
jgi:serine protease Do